MNYLKNEFTRLSNILVEGIQIVLPAALSTLAEMSIQDIRIGKIVGGVGLTMSGACLAVRTGIPRQLKLRILSGNILKNNDSSFKTAFRWSSAATGLLISAYGIYNIAIGVLELTNFFENEDQIEQKLHRSLNSKFLNYQSHLDSCEERVLKAKERFLSCPEGQKIWNEVERKGFFFIKCASQKEAPLGASVSVDKREIYLLKTNKEMIHPLLVELTNLEQAETLQSVSLGKCSLEVEDYVREVESYEYQTVKKTHIIADYCFKNGFWPEEVNVYKESFNGESTDDWSSLEGYLKTQEEWGHSDLYRAAWYSECRGWEVVKF